MDGIFLPIDGGQTRISEPTTFYATPRRLVACLIMTGRIAQRPVCKARCAGFYIKDGSQFEQIVVIVAYILRVRARTFAVFSPAARRPCYRAFAGWAACRPVGGTRPDAFLRVSGPSGDR